MYVGIDLGTTNSAAAVFDGQAVTVIRNMDGGSLTPSVVRIDKAGRTTVGERARKWRDTDPENVRAEFKRLMGTAHTLTFAASGAVKKPEELSAEILRALRADIERQTGVVPDRAVIAVPALFELPQIRATSEAARMAGFQQVEMLQEPVASAIAAGWRASHDDSNAWLVYDLGGGTFDVSLLESQEGLLRVVGHDGDNFLGGRDIDTAIMDHCVQAIASSTGLRLERKDSAHAAALRRLRHAVEDAKIELSTAEDAAIAIMALSAGDTTVDVDLTLTRAELDRIVAPLIDRSVAICHRLLARHGVRDGGVARVVLVGGPTVMPSVRSRIEAALGAIAGPGFDPMTLVAQGAALHAAAMNLPTRAAAPTTAASGPRVWLQYPALTNDLAPWVVGRLMEDAGAVEQVRFVREDGAWTSDAETPDVERTFSASLHIRPRVLTSFKVEGLVKGAWLALSPPQIALTHGVSVGDPPLARSIGVALADDTVRTFLERGAPLPMRRTHTLRSAEPVHPGATGHALRVPIVQGELGLAHLCRLVGTLEIPAEGLRSTLPANSAIEVTLDVDRGGQLRVSARISALDQSFDQVALLVAPQVPVEALIPLREELGIRTSTLRASAFRGRSLNELQVLAPIESQLAELDRDIDAATGGELDALERARRGLADVDGILAEVEGQRAWPALVEEVQLSIAWASSWVMEYGTRPEQAGFQAASGAIERGISRKDAREITRHRAIVTRLASAAYLRSEGAWDRELDWIEGRINLSADPPRVAAVVRQGRDAQKKGDTERQIRAVREGWALMPADAEERKRSFDSGVR